MLHKIHITSETKKWPQNINPQTCVCFTCSRIKIFLVIFFVLWCVCCVTFTLCNIYILKIWRLKRLLTVMFMLWAATLCSNICQSTSYRMYFVQQKHWNLVVRQQERGEKKDQGSWWGSQRSAWTLSAKQLLEQQSYPFPGWRKTLGMPG